MTYLRLPFIATAAGCPVQTNAGFHHKGIDVILVQELTSLWPVWRLMVTTVQVRTTFKHPLDSMYTGRHNHLFSAPISFIID